MYSMRGLNIDGSEILKGEKRMNVLIANICVCDECKHPIVYICDLCRNQSDEWIDWMGKEKEWEQKA